MDPCLAKASALNAQLTGSVGSLTDALGTKLYVGEAAEKAAGAQAGTAVGMAGGCDYGGEPFSGAVVNGAPSGGFAMPRGALPAAACCAQPMTRSRRLAAHSPHHARRDRRNLRLRRRLQASGELDACAADRTQTGLQSYTLNP